MPRGRETFNLQVPARGLQLNVPVQDVGLDGLLPSSQNMYLDFDGLFRARNGYQPLASLGPGYRIMGGCWFKNASGIEQYVVAGTNKAAALVSGVWTDITGPNPLNGSPDDPVRFTTFYLNGRINLIFVNNNDPPKIWHSGMATYFDLTPTYTTTGTVNSYSITNNQDTPGLNGVVQYFIQPNLTNTGASTLTLQPSGTSYPIYKLGPTGLQVPLTGGELLAGAVVNMQISTLTGTAAMMIGYNAQAPGGRDITTVANRVMIYNVITPAGRTPPEVAWTTTYDPTVWGQDNFFIFTDSNDPGVALRQFGNNAALCYGEQSIWLARALGQVSDAEAFTFNRLGEYQPGPVSSAGPVVIETDQYFLANDMRIWMIDQGLNPTPVSDAVTPMLQQQMNEFYRSRSHGSYLPELRQVWTFFCPLSGGDPTMAVVLRTSDGMYEPQMIFSEPITASWMAEVQIGATWANSPNPWTFYKPPWLAYPVTRQMGMEIGTDAGQVHSFSAASASDNGTPIPWAMTPGPINLGPLNNVLPDSIELFLASTGASEYVKLALSSLQFPLDPSPQLLFDMPIDTADSRTYALATLLPSDKRNFRWLEITVSGTTVNRAFAYGGGTFFAYQEERGTNEGQ